MYQYTITVTKIQDKFQLVVDSRVTSTKPRFFKRAEDAIAEANDLAAFYNNATVILEV